MRVAAIIVAAGSGRRMQSETPKQFLEIHGRPILWYTLKVFQECDAVDKMITVLPPDYTVAFNRVIQNEWNITKNDKVITGADKRHESVWNGLSAVSEDIDIVMIHDGVRPLVSRRIIQQSIEAANEYGAAVVGLKPKDTIKVVSNNLVERTLNRESLLAAQTPQTFRRDVILRANQAAFEKNLFNTDDAALVEQLGEKVAVVPGDYKNIKITSPEDIYLAAFLLKKDE